MSRYIVGRLLAYYLAIVLGLMLLNGFKIWTTQRDCPCGPQCTCNPCRCNDKVKAAPSKPPEEGMRLIGGVWQHEIRCEPPE